MNRSDTLHLSDRATRYPIHITVHYRPQGDLRWHEGQAENISRSGLLFRAEDIIKRNTPVELNFVLPVKIFGECGAQVICHGTVVRTVLPAASDESPALAAKILNYRLRRLPQSQTHDA